MPIPPMPRRVPSPRARRLLDDLLTLTVEDVLWVRDELRRRLEGDDEDEGGSGVREPRRSPPESPGDAIALVRDDEDVA